MVMKKAQQEEKAKGLIGLKKGKKVAGAPYSVGNYKRKSLNLKDKQLGAAGRKAAAVRGGKKVSISNTRYDTTNKKVYGPAGNLLTGRVDLGGGNIGVYRNGVRVTAKKKSAPSRGAGGGTGGKGGGTTTPSRPGGTPNYISGKPDKPGKPRPVRKRGGYVGGPTYMGKSKNDPYKNLPYGGVKRPSPNMPGPASVGVKNPSDGQMYRFGPPNNQSVWKWNSKTKKFTNVRSLA